MKRIVTIQDISCIGRCSITVALPIISAMGIETAIIPTAVLSTHTAFRNFTCKDLDDQIEPITNHWIEEKLDFSCIYTGYLANTRQIDLVEGVIEKFSNKDNLIIVDPAMGDNGRLYPAFEDSFAKEMCRLCAKADVILPNITEACYLTGTQYLEVYDESYIKELLQKLAKLGSNICILTGVGFENGKTGVYGYEGSTDSYYYYEKDRVAGMFHGTGDIFASTFTGAMMNEKSWKESVQIAADYTARCIEATLEDEKRCWYGVNFEQEIPYLLRCIGKN